ncbi:MAG TPA: ribose-5-phosphate isomerase RpiA [Xanthomonadales bacterium]|nr:ribose-5-phosphate isomerase RpiA [Xanthomonadales bacterium]
MTQDEQKRRSAEAAMRYVEDGAVIGVGTGSTVNLFIPLLAKRKFDIEGAVSSSEASTALLKQHGIRVLELNNTGDLPVYIDGADECDTHFRLIKGGGGALTREKIIAGASRKFVCLIDQSKRVELLGNFPLPVEVIPMARSFVARQIVKLGGHPVLREACTTDNGNLILDVHGLQIVHPEQLERDLNQVPGVVTVGLFALRKADVVICAGEVLQS